MRALIFPEEIELAESARVLKANAEVEMDRPREVLRVESPNWSVEKFDAVVVLRVENVVRAFDVCPMVVESVLKEMREMLDRVPREVLRELTATRVIEKLLEVIVEKEENPERRSVPTLLIPTRRVLVSYPRNVE